MIEAILSYAFLRNALFAAILSSIVCGIIGTIIVEKKLVSISGGIAHTSFGGIGLGYLINIEPIIGGLVFSVMASLGISVIKRKTGTKADTLIGIFWSVGMALGILFIALMPGYPPDMTSYLFGNILTVSTEYITWMTILTIVITFIIMSIFNYWKAYLFDEEFIKVIGVKTQKLEYLLYVIIACTIVIQIKVVGIILVIALLTIPPAIARLISYELKNIMLISIIVGIVFSISGLVFSYYFNVPSGATIILLSAVGYFIFIITKKYIKTAEKDGHI